MSKKEHKPKEVSQVEVHSVPRFSLNTRKKNFITVGTLLVLVIVASCWLIFRHVPSNQAGTSKDTAPAVASDPTAITKDNVASRDSKQIDAYIKKNANSTSQDTIIVVAKGYEAKGDYNAALDKYKQAATSVSATDYSFYNDYALVAARAGKPDLAIQLYEKAKTALASSSIDENSKKNETNMINIRIDLVKNPE